MVLGIIIVVIVYVVLILTIVEGVRVQKTWTLLVATKLAPTNAIVSLYNNCPIIKITTRFVVVGKLIILLVFKSHQYYSWLVIVFVFVTRVVVVKILIVASNIRGTNIAASKTNAGPIMLLIT